MKPAALFFILICFMRILLLTTAQKWGDLMPDFISLIIAPLFVGVILILLDHWLNGSQ